MNKILIMHAFAKAEQEIKNKGIIKPSLTEKATEISNYLEGETNFIIGERSLRDYRSAAQKLENDDGDIRIKQVDVISGLCSYLGYENYQDFVKRNEKPKVDRTILTETPIVKPTVESLPKKSILRNYRFYVLIGIMCILLFWLYNYTTRQRWMVWTDDHYIEVDFDAKKYDIKQLKLYKEDRIVSFKKIKVTCLTDFFHPDGSVLVWYGKNREKQLEYFTDLGLHPETGKTLKPISGYMINKHICVE
ncbi:hypothetical protein [Nonlabens sp.]|uniref:hypothetical protein n=2 Tax=Nonlabens sp. TaxID=1888209 RepID=UPI003262F935